MKIGSVVIDCNNFDRMAAFWQEALHYVPREPAEDGWVVLKDPEDSSPNVSVNQTSEPKSGKNRLHLDLYTADQKTEVERLLRIGATLHRLPEEDEDFVVLADPEGNLFCVVDKTKPGAGTTILKSSSSDSNGAGRERCNEG